MLYIYSKDGNIFIHTYPQGKRVSRIHLSNELINGVCSNSQGDVFVIAFNGSGAWIYEYAHGGTTPIATLETAKAGISCTVDPSSGNLAILGIDPYTKTPGVAIYQNASGNPEYYDDPYLSDLSSGSYDGNGDLILTGWTSGDVFTLTILRAGSSQFSLLTLDKQLTVCGCDNALTWDGKDLALTYSWIRRRTALYQIAVSGSDGTVVGHGLFHGPASALAAILGDTIIFPAKRINAVGFWRYPKGHHISQLISMHGKGIWGAVVSVTPER